MLEKGKPNSGPTREIKYFTAMKINEIEDMNIIAVSVISAILKINPLPLKKEKFRTSTGFEPWFLI